MFVIDKGKYKENSSKWKWSEEWYSLQEEEDVTHKNVKKSAIQLSFLQFPFLLSSHKTTWSAGFKQELLYVIRYKTRAWHICNIQNTLSLLCMVCVYIYDGKIVGPLVLYHPINPATNQYNIAHTGRYWEFLTTVIESHFLIKTQQVRILSRFIRFYLMASVTIWTFFLNTVIMVP